MEANDGRTSILFRLTNSRIRGAADGFVSVDVTLHGLAVKESWETIEKKVRADGLRVFVHEDIQASAVRLMNEENQRLEQANIDLLTRCCRLERRIEELEAALGPQQ